MDEKKTNVNSNDICVMIGWSLNFTFSLFLNVYIAKDEPNLQKSFQKIQLSLRYVSVLKFVFINVINISI